MSLRLKVVWVVTVPYVVKYHLPNTLKRMPVDFDVCVVGKDVTQFQDLYPEIKWVDIAIERKISLFADLHAVFSLCRFFWAHKPDIVQSLMPKAGLHAAIAGFICRVPVRIHIYTGQVWATKVRLTRIILRAADKIINHLNTACLTDSGSQSKFLYENRISHDGMPLPILLHGSLSGVDVERFNISKCSESAKQLRIDLGIRAEHFVFSFIARKTRDKGAIDILSAFSSISASLEDAMLLFVGPDEDGEIGRLRRGSPELFLNVIDVGHVSNHELYLAITDVLCLPSYREGFGTIVIDAAAMGVPTIGSHIPGLVDSIVDGETGMLFPPGDLDELIKLMIAQIDNPQVREAMGRSAKARVDKYFTAEKHYFALREFYLRYASNHRVTRQKLLDDGL